MYLRIFLVSLIMALSAFALSKLNLFNLDSTFDAASDSVTQRIMAPAYGSGRGQDVISVITIDDTNVTDLRDLMTVQEWPLSYIDYANIIARVRAVTGKPLENGTADVYRPRAIFLDFMFFGDLRDFSHRTKTPCEAFLKEGPNYLASRGRGCEHLALLQEIEAATAYEKWRRLPACLANDLAKLACIVKSGGIPVIVGRPARDMSPVTTEFQEELALRSVVAVVTFDKQAYPMPVATDREQASTLSELSPAAALYAVHCITPGVNCGLFRDVAEAREDRVLNGAQDAFWPERLSRPLSVMWGTRPAPAQKQLNMRYNNKIPCTVPETGLPLTGYAARTIQALLNIAPKRADCHYNRNYPYHALNMLTLDQVERMLDDKLVLIGPRSTRGSDLHDTPLSGGVPGVFIHAMALDNLIEYGTRYRKVPTGTFDSGKILETTLLFSLLVLGYCGVVERHRLRCLSPGGVIPLRRVLWLYGKLLGASIVIIVIFVAAGIWVLFEEPINWLGAGATALTLGVLQKHQPVGEDVMGIIDRGPVGSRLATSLRQLRAWLDIERECEARPASAPVPATATATALAITDAHRSTQEEPGQ